MNFGPLRRIGIVVVLFFTVLSCLSIFSFSIYQTLSNETISIAGNTTNIPCSTAPYSSYHPIRFTVSGASGYIECPWSSLNSSARIISTFVASVVLIVLAFFGPIKKKKWIMWLTVGVSFVFLCVFFALMILDSNDLRISGSWCKNYVLVLPPNNDDLDCSYWTYILMPCVEAVLSLIFLVQGILLVVYGKKYMEDDFTDWSFNYDDPYDKHGYDTDDPHERNFLRIPDDPYS